MVDLCDEQGYVWASVHVDLFNVPFGHEDHWIYDHLYHARTLELEIGKVTEVTP